MGAEAAVFVLNPTQTVLDEGDDVELIDVSYRYDIQTVDGKEVVEFVKDTERTVLALVVKGNSVAEATTAAVTKAVVLGGSIVEVVARNPEDRENRVNAFVGVKEVAQMKGCRTQYASTVSQKAGFPSHETVLFAGPTWLVTDIARWVKQTESRSRSSSRRRR